MITLVVLLVFTYCLIIMAFIIGFDAIEEFKLEKKEAKNKFSIVIPFRNEAENLPQLLNSIKQLNYPLDFFEVLLIDDHSKDDSVKNIHQFKNENPLIAIKILEIKGYSTSPKKNAIKTAIKNSEFEWIVTTDADCEVPKNWLQLFNGFLEKNDTYFIAGPVTFTIKNKPLHYFQQINLASLISSTIGSFGIDKPLMCNGANLCYAKAIFNEVNGFEGNSKIASGDDVFLLEKMCLKYPKKVHYLKSKEAMVFTQPENTFKNFYNQQLRWAGKSGAYKNWFTILVGSNVLLMNLIIVCLVIALIKDFQQYFNYFITAFIVKSIADFILISQSSDFFNLKIKPLTYLISTICYPFFVVIIGILSFFKKYTWKERSYKK